MKEWAFAIRDDEVLVTHSAIGGSWFKYSGKLEHRLLHRLGSDLATLKLPCAGVPVIDPKATDSDLLGYLDELLRVQGKLMFAKEDFADDEAEIFGVGIMDFMRLHGMRLRAIVADHVAKDALE